MTLLDPFDPLLVGPSGTFWELHGTLAHGTAWLALDGWTRENALALRDVLRRSPVIGSIDPSHRYIATLQAQCDGRMLADVNALPFECGWREVYAVLALMELERAVLAAEAELKGDESAPWAYGSALLNAAASAALALRVLDVSRLMVAASDFGDLMARAGASESHARSAAAKNAKARAYALDAWKEREWKSRAAWVRTMTAELKARPELFSQSSVPRNLPANLRSWMRVLLNRPGGTLKARKRRK